MAQLLSFFLAGAGHGWLTPLWLSFALWLLIPLTLFIAWPSDRGHRLALMALSAIALAADAMLIRGAIDEARALRFYVEINGVVGLLIIGLWLTLWLFWQAILLHALIAGHTRS